MWSQGFSWMRWRTKSAFNRAQWAYERAVAMFGERRRRYSFRSFREKKKKTPLSRIFLLLLLLRLSGTFTLRIPSQMWSPITNIVAASSSAIITVPILLTISFGRNIFLLFLGTVCDWKEDFPRKLSYLYSFIR